MKNRVFAYFLVLAVFMGQSNYTASADSSKTWNYSNKYITSDFVVKQENILSGENFGQGAASVTVSISRLEPKFEYFIDSNQDTNSYNAVLSPNPEWMRVNPGPTGVQSEMFFATADIWISDNPDFDVTKSKTYFAASISIAMDQWGRVLPNHPMSDVLIHDIRNLYKIDNDDYYDNYELDANFDTYLTKSVRGYIFELPNFLINSTGNMYVQTKTDLFQKWMLSYPSVFGSSSIAYNDNKSILNVSKLSQNIAYNAPKSVLLKNKLARISFSSISGLPVTSRETDSSICIVDGDLIYLISAGNCEVSLSQVGDENYEAAPILKFSTEVLADEPKKTVICTKGKTSKKLVGKSVCPKGYTLKK